jgi:ABC-2 type transport system ATP-binding protein
MLDEPVNGLDPDGIRWIRGLLRDLATEGRTVFVSSHLMSEMSMTADHLVVIGRGRLIADAPIATLTSTTQLRVRTPEPDRLRALFPASDGPDGTLLVTDVDAGDLARTALAHSILIVELTPTHPSLEDAYYALTRGEVEYTTTPGRAAA